MLRSSSVSTLHAGGVDERHKKSLLRKYIYEGNNMITFSTNLLPWPLFDSRAWPPGRGRLPGRGAGAGQPWAGWWRWARCCGTPSSAAASAACNNAVKYFSANIFPACLPVLLGGDVVRRGEAGRGVGEGVARAGPLQGDRG